VPKLAKTQSRPPNFTAAGPVGAPRAFLAKAHRKAKKSPKLASVPADRNGTLAPSVIPADNATPIAVAAPSIDINSDATNDQCSSEGPLLRIKSPAPSSKLGILLSLLRQPEGASLPAMMAATSWHAHSVRGAMAGAIKKKLGLKITSEKSGATRTWRIVKDCT